MWPVDYDLCETNDSAGSKPVAPHVQYGATGNCEAMGAWMGTPGLYLDCHGKHRKW